VGLEEVALVKFLESLAEFGLSVHDDRAIPGDRFFERLSGNEQEADAIIAGLDYEFIAAIEKDERTIVGRGGRGGVRPRNRFSGDGERVGSVTEFSRACENISEGMASGFNPKRLAAARGDRNIEVHGVGSDAIHRASGAPEFSADDTNVCAIVIGDLNNVRSFHFLITRRGHFQGRGQIGPELKAMHAASFITLGHFLMDDATARGHPLDVSRGDGAAIADAVAVFDGAREDVGDGFNAAMRVPGETRKIVFWNVVAEIIEEKERIKIGGGAKAKSTPEVHTGSFHGGFCADEALDGPNGHEASGKWNEAEFLDATGSGERYIERKWGYKLSGLRGLGCRVMLNFRWRAALSP